MELTLGKNVAYPQRYSPELLFRIPRSQGRETLSLNGELPFDGVDVWNGYELSWLDEGGIPQTGIATIEYSAASPALVESKSLKLYLGSMYNEPFASKGAVAQTIAKDLTAMLESSVEVTVRAVDEIAHFEIDHPPGVCVERNTSFDPKSTSPVLVSEDSRVRETVHSNILRSLCPVTGQPDWGTVIVSYEGKKLNHDSLCRYLIEQRNYSGFHEVCCEKIFLELAEVLSPTDLCVLCCYTRRGGIDINPLRWLKGTTPLIGYRRLVRQ